MIIWAKHDPHGEERFNPIVSGQVEFSKIEQHLKKKKRYYWTIHSERSIALNTISTFLNTF